MATYVKAWESTRVPIGGLFGAAVDSSEQVLPWRRAEQAAFLILIGQKVRDAIANHREPWMEILRQSNQPQLTEEAAEEQQDAAFTSPYSLLNRDQGIRGLLYITNDLCYVRADDLRLRDWVSDQDASAVDERAVATALESLKDRQEVNQFLEAIADSLVRYDWRTSSAPGLTEDQRTLKAALRGSGGYRELRRQLLRHLSNDGTRGVSEAAKDVSDALGYR